MWWTPINTKLNHEKIKILLCKALEVGINKVIKANVYKYDWKIRKQKNGAAVWLELTWELAGVFMMCWDNKMKKKLREEGVSMQNV